MRRSVKEAIVLLVYIASCLYTWVGLHHHEEWELDSSLYCLVQIVTTVGFGDLTPATTHMRIVMMFFVLESLVIFAYYLNKFMEKLADENQKAMVSLLNSDSAGREILKQARKRRRSVGLAVATALFAAAVFFGAIFYATVENCACSYGQTRIAGCVPDTYDTCVATGGAQKSWADSLYFSVITLTTVGFGDFTCMSRPGRWVGMLWMLFGVTSTANWLTTLTALFYEQRDAEGSPVAPDPEEPERKGQQSESGERQLREQISALQKENEELKRQLADATGRGDASGSRGALQ